ncbi:hypothetical protein MHOL44478_08775 [Mycobacterium holsaticum DSM 44478]|nr:hypothetical protein [Mycolicibacterium holsaticum DSM 44478 = JCM 12374]
MLLGALGATNFGAWKAIQRLLDVGSAANGGAMQSLKWVVAHRSKSAHDADKRRDIGAALVVLLCWSPVLIAVLVAIVVLLPAVVKGVPPNDMRMIYFAGAILGLNVILVTLAAVPDAVLVGTNQGFRSMNVTTAVFIVTNAGMVCAAVLGLGLQGVAAAIAVGTSINGVLTFIVLRKRVPWWGLATPSRYDIGRLSKFSGWVLGWTFVIRLSLATELIVLSAFAGVTFVANYTFTSYVVVFALSVCQLTTSSLMPKLGSAIGNGEWQDARTIAREARELTLALATGIGCLVILFNEAFVDVWVGSGQYMGRGVNVLMTLAFVQFAIIRTDAQIQDTGLEIGKKVILGALMTLGAIAGAGVAFALTGSVELMFITIIAVRVFGTIGFPVLANHTVNSSSWPVGRAAMTVAILGASITATSLVQPQGLIELAVFGAISSAVLVPLVFFTALSPPTRVKLLRR